MLQPPPHQERISWSHRENSLGDQEKSLGETSPGDQETFHRVFPPGDYLLVIKRNFLVFVLRRLTACFSGPLRRLTAYISRQSQRLTACFSGPLRRIAAYFSAPFTLTFLCKGSLKKKTTKVWTYVQTAGRQGISEPYFF